MARVLVVEDESRLARLVARVLGEEGYAVETVGDSRSALMHQVSRSSLLLPIAPLTYANCRREGAL